MNAIAKPRPNHRAAALTRLSMIAVLVTLALAAHTAPAFAGVKPVILATSADLAAGTLTVAGTNFGSVAPIVKLGGDLLTVLQSNQTEIVATLPPGLADGSYLLSVKKAGAAEVTATVTLDAGGGSDGPGHEIQDFASVSGNVLIPNGTVQFFGQPVEVTTTKPLQHVLVVATNAFGTMASAANSLNLTICYQATSGPLTYPPPYDDWIVGLRVPAWTRVTHSLNKIIQLPTAGTYTVGMCGTSGSANWIDNGQGMTSALVF